MRNKKNIAIFSAIALMISMILSSQAATAQDQGKEKLEFVKERAIAKTYPASGNSLVIENSFGNVKIVPWDKNEIKVDIAIKVESSDKENAERIFDNINVLDSQTGDVVRFKTEQKSDNSNNCKNCRTNMRISYEVKMPVNGKLTVRNSFGNIELPDYKGPVSIVEKFGSLTAGVLSDVKDLKVEFGKAQLKSLSDADVSFKFSTVQVENLSGTSKVSMGFCDSSKIVLSSNLTSLTLSESYSTVNLRPAGNLGATYNIETSFGTFIDRTDIGVVRTDARQRFGPDSNRQYEGKAGNGSSKINVKSSFGKVILGDAKPDDMKKTSKSRSNAAGRVI